jgi:hypothetical protein
MFEKYILKSYIFNIQLDPINLILKNIYSGTMLIAKKTHITNKYLKNWENNKQG